MACLCCLLRVVPSYFESLSSLVTIALNSAFHNDVNPPVEGPFRKIWRVSRIKFFYLMFGAMFVWFWFPNYIWVGLSKFNWISWIAPGHRDVNVITGINNGLGVNPFPTW